MALMKLQAKCDNKAAAKSIDKYKINRCTQMCEDGVSRLAEEGDLMKEDCYRHNGKLCECSFRISTDPELAQRFTVSLMIFFLVLAAFGGALALTCTKAQLQCKPENTAQQEIQFFGRFPHAVLTFSILMLLTCWATVWAAPLALLPAVFGIVTSVIQLCCAPLNQRPLTAPVRPCCGGCTMWVKYLYSLYISIAVVTIIFGVLPGTVFFLGIFHSMAQCGYGGSKDDDDFPALLFGAVAFLYTLCALILCFFATAAAHRGFALTRTAEFQAASNQGGFSAVQYADDHSVGNVGLQMAVVNAVAVRPTMPTYDPATSRQPVPAASGPVGDLLDNDGRPISL
jgi:hypothetical protein